MSDNYVTKGELEKMKARLEELKKEILPRIRDRVEEARAEGDLSENDAYRVAQEDLSRAEIEIMKLEQFIKGAKVLTDQDDDIVSLGDIVEVEIRDQVKKYTILGSNSADPENGVISGESPLGKTLLGQKEGSTVEYKAPNGATMEINIKKVNCSDSVCG